jgi:hypothetical protein
MSDQNHTRVVGTPKDYTEDLYRVYFEVGEYGNLARDVMTQFLLSRSGDVSGDASSPISLREHAYGYEVDIPLQVVPEIVRALAAENVAIYQVIRINKL